MRESELQLHSALLGRPAPFGDVCLLRLQVIEPLGQHSSYYNVVFSLCLDSQKIYKKSNDKGALPLKSKHLKFCSSFVRLEKASGENPVRVEMSWYHKIHGKKGGQSTVDSKVPALNNILRSLRVLYVVFVYGWILKIYVYECVACCLKKSE